MNSIYIHLIDCDTRIEEHVVVNDDGSYTILINARHSRKKQLEAYWHAVRHIMQNDFGEENADQIEKAM